MGFLPPTPAKGSRLLHFAARTAPSSLRTSIAVLLLALCLPAAAPAQSPAEDDPLLRRYLGAMGFFEKAEFPKAISELQKLLTDIGSGPGADSVRYSLAAAHFNSKDYKKARERFSEYLKLHPDGAKAVDAKLSLAQCELSLGDKNAAARGFAEVAQLGGVQKEQALLAQASVQKSLGKKDDAIATLQPILSGGLRSSEAVRAAMLLASLEAGKGARDKALKIVELLFNHPELVENLLEFNAIAFEVGDSFIRAKEPRKAIQAYALIRPKGETLAIQRRKVENLKRLLDSVPAAASDSPKSFDSLARKNALQTALKAATALLAETEKKPSLLGALRIRQARAYAELGRNWEGIVLLESVLSSGDSDGKEEVLFALGNAHSEAGNPDESIAILDRLLQEFPKAKNGDTALHLAGVQYLRAEKFDRGAPYFGRLVQAYPNSKLLESALFLHANALFALGHYDKAKGEYENYTQRFPKGENVDETFYRIALCDFSTGNYAKALPAFQDYSKKNRNGAFASDALYREAVCLFAAREFDRTIKLCDEWEKDFGYPSLRAEVLSLKGDALAAQEKRSEAVGIYKQAIACAQSDRVSQYALMEANKQLQRLGYWEQSTAMFRDFVAANPEHPAVPSAIYWMTRSMIKEGKTGEAKAYLSSRIFLYLEDRNKDAVEPLLTQLAQICSKRPPGTAPAESPGAGAANPQPTPSYDPSAELNRILAQAKSLQTPLGKARLLFAEAELLRFTKRQEEADKILDRIAEQSSPAVLGASLLALSGDRLWSQGKEKKAEAFYVELLKAFPRAEVLDYAYNGLAQIALKAGQNEKAIELFDAAIDKAGALNKLKDITLGRGKALLALGRFDEAKPLFEQVASTREWKGESTAEAVYLIGETLFRKGLFNDAVQYFQRVFVAYQRYSSTVARAYLRAAECFINLHEIEKARLHYREILLRPKLANLPEAETAKKRLAELQTP
ncbi:MAG: hypothetical protein RLZZ244_76 [Verrucomicrobiota bacterium]|jgi:TolA-binding protein